MDSVATFCGLAPSQEWKKGDVVFVLQYPLHGRDLVVYRHQDSIFWKRKFRMFLFDICQDVSNTSLLWKPDLNLVTLGFRPLQAQEGNGYVHGLFSEKGYIKQLGIIIRSTLAAKCLK